MEECVTAKKPPVLMTWWQGGERYADNISENGKELLFPFEGPALYGAPLWEQLEPDVKLKQVDFGVFFDKKRPLNFEIGMGNGEFIVKYAAGTPDENWLGVEVFRKVFAKAESRAVRSGLKNIRMIQFDAALILRLIPDGTLNSVYVNFPDPWPKSGHKRRRLLKTHFINLMASKLRPGGILQMVTDHDDYAEEICENLKGAEGIKSLFGSPYSRDTENCFHTKYYRKFAEKAGAYFFRYEKISGAD